MANFSSFKENNNQVKATAITRKRKRIKRQGDKSKSIYNTRQYDTIRNETVPSVVIISSAK